MKAICGVKRETVWIVVPPSRRMVGVTVEECEELAQAVHDAGVVLQAGTQRRYDANIAYAAD